MVVISLIWSPNDHQRKVIARIQAMVVDGRLELVRVLSQPRVEREGRDHVVQL